MASDSSAFDHLNSAWLTAGKKQAVPSSGASYPQPCACSPLLASPLPGAAASAAASAAAAAASGDRLGARLDVLLELSHSSPKGVALVNPATRRGTARMQIGTRISFGDSCGVLDVGAVGVVGVVAAVGVVASWSTRRTGEGDDGRLVAVPVSSSPSCWIVVGAGRVLSSSRVGVVDALKWAAAPRGSPKNVR